ncbi:hypothetical protein AKJ41_04495 [candidate division MSBL1 archaeon SCGC-AAA259O05]|uniref:Uncharacterized protein n=2 Tax=candidate division MSBL1 TaxID=215777 RepID=A0A133V0N4_9EURY|nr:hypothetical protein AKJ64_03965 [candidate division MSBL1 archaeon SCGC-AAA259E17]KXA99993.1 hypothetical protein AKJ41_04495 [candidate division MSBL1 archaeon SCGC-AAA259O05]
MRKPANELSKPKTKDPTKYFKSKSTYPPHRSKKPPRRKTTEERSEIHSWVDKPSKLYGKSHRKERHDKDKTPDKAEEMFWDEVPEQYRDYIRDAV